MHQTSARRWLSRLAGSPGRRLVGFFLMTWLGVAGLFFFLVEAGRSDAEEKARADAQNVSALLEARVDAHLQRMHGSLEHVLDYVTDNSALGAVEGQREMARELSRLSRRFPEVERFQVLDGAGRIRYGTDGVGGPAQPVAYFDALRALGNGELYISPVAGDAARQRFHLIFAIVQHAEDGSMIGAVAAEIRLDQFDALLNEVALGANGMVAIRRVSDGTVLVRRPWLPALVNQPLVGNPLHEHVAAGERSGVFRLRGALDGIERVYGFRRIGGYPLYVTVGLASRDYLGDWRHTISLAGFVAIAFCLITVLVLIRLLRLGRKEAEMARLLTVSEARYRMLAENSHDVIWVLDIETRRLIYVSPSIFAATGFSADELLGQAMDCFLSANSAAQVAREIDLQLRRIAAGDTKAKVLVEECEMRTKDGGMLVTEVVSSYVLDGDGVARTVLGIARNVTERKAAESALRDSNRQLRCRIEEIGRLQSALQELAVRDSLTGLYNRRYLDETLDREVSRARREGSPLSLVMLDIDYFKRVNDTYGHQVGDEVLRRLARTLLSDVRAEDVACRYGGEEFAILLPSMPLDAAQSRAEAWRAAVESLQLSHGNFQIAFTISLGVAAYPDHGKTPDELTRCADRALYCAKHAGRNRVCVPREV